MIGRMSLKTFFTLLVILPISIVLLGSSNIPASDNTESVRAFTRQIEFNYITWTLEALQDKLDQVSLGTVRYLPGKLRKQTVLEYLDLVSQTQGGEAALREIYSDPEISDPDTLSQPFRDKLQEIYNRRALLAPLAESILQSQLSQIVAEMGLTLGGQPIPPILYRTTPLPLALIVSPREAIRQDNNISLLPDINMDEQVALEEQVSGALDVSSLVVGIGG